MDANKLSIEAYVGWTGMLSASSISHFNSSSGADRSLETVEIDPQYAQSLGLSQGDIVCATSFQHEIAC